MLTVTRSSPADRSGSASSARRCPLVVNDKSSTPRIPLSSAPVPTESLRTCRFPGDLESMDAMNLDGGLSDPGDFLQRGVFRTSGATRRRLRACNKRSDNATIGDADPQHLHGGDGSGPAPKWLDGEEAISAIGRSNGFSERNIIVDFFREWLKFGRHLDLAGHRGRLSAAIGGRHDDVVSARFCVFVAARDRPKPR